MKQDDPTWKTSLPFPRHWLAYIAIKFAVLAIVVAVTLRLTGVI